MKKNSTVAVGRKQILKQAKWTIGLDLGDRTSYSCILDEVGNVIWERQVPTMVNGIRQAFGRMRRCRIALETGTHSPWVSRQLSELGHEVIVAHARKVRLIGESSRKDDRLDARTLARLARIDPGLLGPVKHRSAEAQIHLTVIRARAALVSTRVDQIVWPAAEEMRHGTDESGQFRGAEPGIARCVGSSVARDRIAERAHRGIPSSDRTDRQGSSSGSGAAQTSERRGDADCVDVRFHSGRSTPISSQSRRGMFSGTASWAQELWPKRTATAHQQGRRPLSEDADGTRSALHSGAFWRRQ
jgi:Transposase